VEPSETPLQAQIDERCGKVLSFTNPIGEELKLLLPSEPTGFEPLTRLGERDAKSLFACLNGWARIYRLDEESRHRIEVIGVGEEAEGLPPIYRVTFERPQLGKRDHFRKYPVQVTGAERMSVEELECFLSDIIRMDKCDKSLRSDRTQRAREAVAWIGPQYLGDTKMELELKIISELLGVQLRPYWSSQNPNDAYKTFIGSGIAHFGMFVWRSHARKLCALVAEHAQRNSILLYTCDEDEARAMLDGLKSWLDDKVIPELAKRQLAQTTLLLQETEESYLAFMLHSMDTHHKMAVCNHCSIEQVTTPIRGRGGNVAWATELLGANSEKYEENVVRDAIFLRKERGTEVKFFVNKNALAKVNELLRNAGFPETHRRRDG
jgi:hypothetical protein